MTTIESEATSEYLDQPNSQGKVEFLESLEITVLKHPQCECDLTVYLILTVALLF